MANSSLSVSKGEKCPIAVQVIPASRSYNDFTINQDGTRVEILNSAGSSVTVHGDILIDNTNKTVVFSWDTSQYDIGAYTITIWVSITYLNTNFLIRSNSISKSIKQSSVIG